ncbi:hypothetical protein [Nitrospirillum iridis]|uniref:Uncharacterized protein n=1 Tax=Nitrospirillum iridis TaxID=765888 RepID=A0A7X0B1Y8_9PROT|nr:hypothetical protein [Nitrospirillum iridis]MBB6254225.1 hypothetical protein [Nitrospirillum iridis]
MSADGAFMPKGNYVSNATAAAGGALIVPLYLMNCGGTRKVGIEVALSVPGGAGSVTRLYEFDTGGKGFWASAAGLDLTGAQTAGPIVTQYTSGITYLGTATRLQVTLAGVQIDTAPTSMSADLYVGVVSQLYELQSSVADGGRVAEKGGGNDEQEQPASFPIYDYFYGDFGVALAATSIVPASQQPVALNHPLPDGAPSLDGYNEWAILGALSQFQPAIANPYFIIDLANTDASAVWDGNPPKPAGDAATSVTAVGRLIIGGSAALVEGFQHIFPLLPNAGGSFYSPDGTTASQTDFVVATEQQIAGTLIVDNSSKPPPLATTFTMDTGCPQVTLHAGSQLVASEFTPGTVTLTATDKAGRTLTLYSNGGGKWDSTVSPSAPDGYVNSALDPFLAYPTAFWLCANALELPLGVPGTVMM